MQLLYQIDQRGEADREAILDAIDESFDPPQVRAPAIELAVGAWARRQKPDELATELAPDWPTYRQPPIDRAILRLAWHEMITERTPVKVAINEAVELAKQYSTEQSPSFVNGVLDKMAKRLAEGETTSSASVVPIAEDEPTEASPHDTWLADAVASDAQRPPTTSD